MKTAKVLQILDNDGLQTVFAEMHKDVAKKVTKNAVRQIRNRKKKTNPTLSEFGLGDFVLVRRAQKKATSNRSDMWDHGALYNSRGADI